MGKYLIAIPYRKSIPFHLLLLSNIPFLIDSNGVLWSGSIIFEGINAHGVFFPDCFILAWIGLEDRWNRRKFFSFLCEKNLREEEMKRKSLNF